MAKEGERSAAADKGKEKVNDVRELNGSNKPQKEEKTQVNGKKDEEKEGRRALGGAYLRPLAIPSVGT